MAVSSWLRVSERGVLNIPINPHFSHNRMLLRSGMGFSYAAEGRHAGLWRRMRGWRSDVFWISVGPWVMPRDRRAAATRRQTGEARALAAVARRRAAPAHSSAAGQAEAMAIRTRRTEMRISAPIFRSLSLMVPQVASAKTVLARPMRRNAQIRT